MTEAPDPSIAETLLWTLVRPKRAFESLRTIDRSGPGGAAVAVLGMLWGLLCFLLWSAGREAHAVLLPVEATEYYLWQGLFMLPIVTAQWWLFSEVAHRVARGEGGEGAARSALGYAFAAPLLLHVAAEILTFLLAPEQLGAVARISLPLASLWVWALSALALKTVRGVSTGRAVLASFAGLLVQALVGALAVR